MASSITGAERLPDGDYSISHRAPPPVPSPAYHSTQSSFSSPKKPLHEPARPATGQTSVNASSVHTNTSTSERRRRGSFSSFLRRSSSNTTGGASQQNHYKADGSSGDVPPVPSVPATRIAQAAAAHQAASSRNSNSEPHTRQFSLTNNSNSNSSRKVSGEGGRTMLRKVSKAKQREDAERVEQERLARARQPPPRLPSHNPLPGIDSFGGEYNSSSSNTALPLPGHSSSTAPANNFSRPGNAFANMSPAAYNSSSSPAYAVRAGKNTSSSPFAEGKGAGTRTTNGEYVSNSVDRSESMTNRGRYSYASSVNHVNVSSPRRVRRRKDPTPFNVLFIGAKNSGKTSFITFLRHSLALPVSKSQSSERDSTVNASKSSFTSHYLETEMDGERVGLTLWDSAGLEKNIVDLQLREMAAFVESKFEETFVEEQKVMRSPGIKDTHIHCAFLILDPIRLDATVAASSAFQKGNVNLDKVSGLEDDLDLQVLRALWGKTTVIPVIAKADTLTIGHMSFLKRAVWESIKSAKLDPLEALELEDDIDEETEYESAIEEESSDRSSDVIDNLADSSSDSESNSKPTPTKANKTHNRQTSSLASTSIKSRSNDDDETPYIPMSILSPDPYDLPPYVPAKSIKATTTPSNSSRPSLGRRFPWGYADPYNAEHCDFTRLRDSIFSEWRGELRDLSRSKWYENWRTSRLKNVPGSKQRVRGGVTPVGVVPREGRMSPKATRTFSPTAGAGVANAGYAEPLHVPRSVSGTNSGAEEGRPSKVERMMGAGAGAAEMRATASRGA